MNKRPPDSLLRRRPPRISSSADHQTDETSALEERKLQSSGRRFGDPLAGRANASFGLGAQSKCPSRCSLANFLPIGETKSNWRWLRTIILPILLLLVLAASGLLAATGWPIVGLQQQQQNQSSDESLQQQQQLAPNGSNPISVQTKQHGQFRGVLLFDGSSAKSGLRLSEEENVAGFLGIRYASAPIKRLRFMPPTAFHYAANQIHEAQQFGSICPQRLPLAVSSSTSTSSAAASARSASGAMAAETGADLDQQTNATNDRLLASVGQLMPSDSFAYLRPLWLRLGQRRQSEDCLNLNIYAPLQAIAGQQGAAAAADETLAGSKQLPVLVIVHGESFDFGSGSTINAFKIVRQSRGQLIAVTFNYRLNIFGFPPKLAGASRGNLGLMDQIAALHWIKDNIGAFGGSPNNITLMGTKRAAVFVNLLMLSPLAKGLFQRVVMEDGAALAPFVATRTPQPQAQVSARTPMASGAASHQPAVQHVRLLAKLCDCPVYRAPPVATAAALVSMQSSTSAGQSPNGNSTSGKLHRPLAATPSATTSSQQADEVATNALTFECLRRKSPEQILQPLPLDVLRLDPLSAELLIEAKWLAKIQLHTANYSSSWMPPSGSPQIPASEPNGDDDEAKFVQIDTQTVRSLLAAATRWSVRPTNGPDYQQQQQQQQESDQTSEEIELLGALYAPPSESLRPLFGPVVDGSIVPADEDLATMMLNSSGLFAQRDLLIGLSRKLVTFAGHHSDLDTTAAAAAASDDADDEVSVGLDNPIYARIRAKVENSGLTNEQALEMVNVFVRSFYRYHNQEITNSIINHYLSSIGLQHQLRTQRQRNKLQRRPSRYRHRSPSNITSRDFQDQQQENSSMVAIERQKLVLKSLLEAHQDALVSVPVIKTSLIHATAQLNPLAEAFVGQQFQRWVRGPHLADSGSDSNSVDKLSLGLATNASEIQVDSKIFELFTSFAETLMSDTNWPLELQAPAGSSQPKATFLFQLDQDNLLRSVQDASRRVMAISSTNNGNINPSSSGWLMLSELLESVQESPKLLQAPTSLSCGLEFDIDSSDFQDIDTPTRELAKQLNDWFCSGFNKLLVQFATSGRMAQMQRPATSSLPENLKPQPVSALHEQMTRFQAECLHGDPVADPHESDHHFVQATAKKVDEEESTGSSLVSDLQKLPTSCTRKLIQIALNCVTGIEDTSDAASGSLHWPVFNVFSQQMATLPGDRLKQLQVNKISESTTNTAVQFNEKSTLLARTSFWSNFIPALNCTRTQPVVPNSLLLTTSHPMAMALNHSVLPLLSTNLQFSCQQSQGPKSALDAIESLVVTIKSKLHDMKTSWLAANSRSLATSSSSTTTQNHHRLRMANMSQNSDDTQSSDLNPWLADDFAKRTELLDSSHQLISADSRHNQSTSSASLATSDSQFVKKFKNRYLLVGVISCGILLTITLVSGACVVMRQRKNQTETCNGIKPPNQEDDGQKISNGFRFAALTSDLIGGNPISGEASNGARGEKLQRLPPIEETYLELQRHGARNIPGSHLEQSNGVISSSLGPDWSLASNQNHSQANSLQTATTSTSTTGTTTVVPERQSNMRNDASSHSHQSGACGGNSLTISDSSPDSNLVGLIACSSGQPIVVPMMVGQQQQNLFDTSNGLVGNYSDSVAHHQNRQSQYRHSCLTNSTSNGNSSSETQIQSSISSLQTNGVSTIKKRVKISDPLGNSRLALNREASRTKALEGSLTTERRRGDRRQMHATNTLSFCPVHSSQQYLATANVTSYNSNFMEDSSIPADNNNLSDYYVDNNNNLYQNGHSDLLIAGNGSVQQQQQQQYPHHHHHHQRPHEVSAGYFGSNVQLEMLNNQSDNFLVNPANPHEIDSQRQAESYANDILLAPGEIYSMDVNYRP